MKNRIEKSKIRKRVLIEKQEKKIKSKMKALQLFSGIERVYYRIPVVFCKNDTTYRRSLSYRHHRMLPTHSTESKETLTIKITNRHQKKGKKTEEEPKHNTQR